MSTQRRRTVLAVDDDEINLMILVKTVQEAGYLAKSAMSGDEAWEMLRDHPDDVDILLLDKMMPGMSGLELLRRVKNTESLRHIPVIMQTGDAGMVQMREGLENGAYYYLTKPFHPEILSAILSAASNECVMHEALFAQMAASRAQFVGLLQTGEFHVRTHDEAHLLAATLAQVATYPEFVALGLMELLSNAVEHGNFDIGCDRKQKCMLMNSWKQELELRAASAEYSNRIVRVHVERMSDKLHVTVTDEGRGFEWQRYLYDDDTSLRLNEPNGRGIAKALIMLDDVHYLGRGNEVRCTIALSPVLSLPQPVQAGMAKKHS